MQTVILEESHGWKVCVSVHSTNTLHLTHGCILCILLLLTNFVFDVTGWGCDRVWAETVCPQPSGTPSVGGRL